ncbi:VOC family protein [Cellulomonas sp. P22]|uniref:VOC family protein n=1 Tax=Cellulomonas sp. P22 TaxID=3373189 RepID=UPI0037AC3194
MTTKVYVNLPVRDLSRSVEFFGRLGFVIDPDVSDERRAGVVLNEDAYVMLLDAEHFATRTSKRVTDPRTHAQAIFSLSAESRERVDEIVRAALDAGGTPAADPIADGPLYAWSFEDPDGHLWEVAHMPVQDARPDAEPDAGPDA